MKLIKKNRGRVTYYVAEGTKTSSTIVTEKLPNGDLRIYFAGSTGHGVEEQGPDAEIPAIFEAWEKILRENDICESLNQLDFLQVNSFGTIPKTPNPIVDPDGYARKTKEISEAYKRAWVKFWSEKMPENGLPARFTVYVAYLANNKANYEISANALLQRKNEAQNIL